MTIQELADIIEQGLRDGKFAPDAIVVRPFCSCDDENGLVEARHLDEVLRHWDAAPGVSPGGRLYRRGNVDFTDAQSAKTVKLW